MLKCIVIPLISLWLSRSVWDDRASSLYFAILLVFSFFSPDANFFTLVMLQGICGSSIWVVRVSRKWFAGALPWIVLWRLFRFRCSRGGRSSQRCSGQSLTRPTGNGSPLPSGIGGSEMDCIPGLCASQVPSTFK